MELSYHLLAPLFYWLATRYLNETAFSFLGKAIALLSCVVLVLRGSLDNNFYLPRGTTRKSMIGLPFRRVKGGFK